MSNLGICQICNEKPATYGDGLTWSKCSECQYKTTKDVSPKEQAPVEMPGGFEHKIVPGLVSIIIPVYMTNYALYHYTGNCIGSIREHTPEGSYEIVIVDNGSPLQVPEMQSYYAHRVIKNEKNLGVTKAWNQGIRASVGEYIVLLNNDVQVYDEWIKLLKGSIDVDGYDLVMAHPMYSKNEPFARAIESAKIRRKVLESGKPFTEFKDFSCVMFKRSLVDEIGLFDEQFFSYASDSDFFYRLDQSGKKWACNEAVATSHLIGATGLMMKETKDIMDKDKESFYKKWNDKKEQETKLIRSKETGDAIFCLLEGKLHHIKDPDTLHALGFEFGQEILLDVFPVDIKVAEQISMENYKKYV